ncbi:MAG: hypothetical protein HY810_04320 [Candidatus Omnitrophica bacterium]|nr:hypothetical protein [Candidatus Omnitrophota bacterium]
MEKIKINRANSVLVKAVINTSGAEIRTNGIQGKELFEKKSGFNKIIKIRSRNRNITKKVPIIFSGLLNIFYV